MRRALSLVAALAGGPAAACPGLEFVEGWVREPPPGAHVAAGYGVLVNTAAATVVIDGVSSPDFAEAMLHRSVIDNGIMRMEHLPQLKLAAAERVTLAPGGLHLMLIGPRTPPVAGGMVRVSLECGAAQSPQEIPVKKGT